MTLLEKIKINIDYLLGNADPSLYAPAKNRNLSAEDWQKRWKVFSEDDGFIWYGVDAEGNLAEFCCEQAYIPESFFQDPRINRQIRHFFDRLPEKKTTELPENLRAELEKPACSSAGANDFWSSGANKGLFIFFETEECHLNKLYELELIPAEPLNVKDLTEEIQNFLKPFHFENLNFADCQFLDVSKYLYCEE